MIRLAAEMEEAEKAAAGETEKPKKADSKPAKK